MHSYILKIKALNLPEGSYMICGSGILEMLGIREAQDIDILVSPELFKNLEEKDGWKRHPKYQTCIEHPEGIAGAKYSLDFMKKDYTLIEVLPKAIMIEGIPFMNLDILIEAKTELAREKDLKDIELINIYLSTKK